MVKLRSLVGWVVRLAIVALIVWLDAAALPRHQLSWLATTAIDFAAYMLALLVLFAPYKLKSRNGEGLGDLE